MSCVKDIDQDTGKWRFRLKYYTDMKTFKYMRHVGGPQYDKEIKLILHKLKLLYLHVMF